MSLKVKLLEYTKDGEKLVALSAKLCYSDSSFEDLDKKLEEESVVKFLNMIKDLHHESPLEHVSYTFYAEGVSRALTHQLVRHRIASYSQQSQRYVKFENMEYVIPSSIERDEYSLNLYKNTMDTILMAYEELSKNLMEKYISEGIHKNTAEKLAIEDARYVFPNATTSKIIITMNARTLLNFFKVRCCNRAQWEIRNLADEMLRLVKEVSPTIFKNAGPTCVTSVCNEGKMCCGKAHEVREKYKN